jgi:hypothetical protein
VSLRGVPETFMVTQYISNVTYLISYEGTREYIFLSTCLDYLHTQVYIL